MTDCRYKNFSKFSSGGTLLDYGKTAGKKRKKA